MNYYAIIQGVNSVVSLLATLAIVFSKQPKKPVHLSYAVWSLVLFAYTSSYFVWGFQTDLHASLFWLQFVLFSCCFIHVCYFHFTLQFSGNINHYKKQLVAACISSVVLILINFKGGFIDMHYIRNKNPFPFWPHASPLLPALIITEIYFVSLSFYILYKSLSRAPEEQKNRLKLFLLVSVIAWGGGLSNWFLFYDATPIPPFGNFGITVYMVVTTYLILKHDLLQLNLAIKRTFVYGSLTFFITMTYILFIVISEKIFQTYLGYSSIIGTALASLTIAILFNPLKNILIKFIEKSFFGKNIEGLSIENLQMKLELQKQDQMKSVATLAAGMAHEIKNPLTAIKTFTEYLPEKHRDPEFIKQYTAIVGNEVDRIDGTVRQLLEFSKPSPLQLERVDMHKLIDETLSFLSGEFIKHNIQLEKNYDAQNPFINGDKKQLKQVFLNLFLNAIQAMPGGGTLTVASTNANPKHLEITISDTGIGIPKENLKHIFEPFFTTKESGTGLGLSIVHGIIREHGGKIWAKNHLAGGAVFKIEFRQKQV